MSKRKGKRTAAEKAERRRRKAEFRTVFVNGKQKRVRRAAHVEGVPLEELLKGADPIFLHQAEMWWMIPVDDQDPYVRQRPSDPAPREGEQDLPF